MPGDSRTRDDRDPHDDPRRPELELLPGAAEVADDELLVTMTHEEWTGLCADLERWLRTGFRRREQG